MKAELAYCDLPQAFVPCEFRIKWADGGWEINQARRLRRGPVRRGVHVQIHSWPMAADIN